MGPEGTREGKIAALQERDKLDPFRHNLYWQQSAHSHEASAEFHRRQDRLEEVRSDSPELRTGARK